MSLSFSTFKSSLIPAGKSISGRSLSAKRTPLGGSRNHGLGLDSTCGTSSDVLRGCALQKCTGFMASITMFLLRNGYLSWSLGDWRDATGLAVSTYAMPISGRLSTSGSISQKKSPFLTVEGSGLLSETFWRENVEIATLTCRQELVMPLRKLSLSIPAQVVRSALQSVGVSIDDIMTEPRNSKNEYREWPTEFQRKK